MFDIQKKLTEHFFRITFHNLHIMYYALNNKNPDFTLKDIQSNLTVKEQCDL